MISFSTDSLRRLRAPLGLPAGFPDCPLNQCYICSIGVDGVQIYRVFLYLSGGETGIRTLDRLSTYTPLAGERFRPLSHLSEKIVLVVIPHCAAAR